MRRDETINVRLSPEEKRVLEILADIEGRTMSEMVRECIREIAEKQGISHIGLLNIGDIQYSVMEGKW